MISLAFSTIVDSLREIQLPPFDLVVGIATGGIVPASLIAYRQHCELLIVRFNYRDEQNRPQHEAPVLLSTISIPDGVRDVLIVDDVAVTGRTLSAAKQHFADYNVSTLVMKGNADYVVLPEIKTCVNWPWKVQPGTF